MTGHHFDPGSTLRAARARYFLLNRFGVDGGYVLNGTKTWATNGGIADIHVVTAVVEPELKALLAGFAGTSRR